MGIAFSSLQHEDCIKKQGVSIIAFEKINGKVRFL